MLLRHIPQSCRIPRLSTHASFIRPRLRHQTRLLLSSATLNPEKYSLSHVLSSSPSRPTFPAYGQSNAASVSQEAVVDDVPETVYTLTTIEDFEAALDHAFSQEHYLAVEAVVDRLVTLYRSETALSFSIFHDLLQREDVGRLSDSTILDILQLIRSSPYEAQSLPPQILQRTLQDRAHNKAIQNVLLDILKLQIRDLEIPKGRGYIQYELPAAIEQGFAILSPLIIKQPQVALDVFNILLEKGYISPASVQDPDLLGSDDVRLIMLCGLAKACIHWNLPHLIPGVATQFRQTKSARSPLVSEMFTTLANTLLHQHHASNSRDTLKACLAIIRTSRVPDNVIRRFYQNAYEHGGEAEAAELYAYTRGVLFEGHRLYPAPGQMALGWLMEHLYATHQSQLCQILAREVLEEDLSVPDHFIANFITFAVLTSPKDDISVARALWDRYARPPGGKMHSDDQYEGPLPLTPPERGNLMVDVRLSLQSNGDLALAMVEGLISVMRAKKAQSELERTTPDNPEFIRLKWEVRNLNVFMYEVADKFQTARKHFKGPRAEWFSYSVRINFAIRRYDNAVKDLRMLLRFPTTKVQQQLPSCLKAMAAYDAGMAAILVQELVGRGIDVAPSICLDVLEKAKEQGDVQVAEEMQALLVRKGHPCS